MIMNQPYIGRSRWKMLSVLGVAFAMGLLASCAPGPNELASAVNAQGKVAGFWLGLWHGLIVLVTFVISLFSKNVQLYEVHNNGACYNAGFLLGACMSLGGGGHGSAQRQRKACTRPHVDRAAPVSGSQ